MPRRVTLLMAFAVAMPLAAHAGTFILANAWSGLGATTPNLFSGGNNDIPSGSVDFESVDLHEVGHCLGLAHPNLASESGVPSADRNYTRASPPRPAAPHA